MTASLAIVNAAVHTVDDAVQNAEAVAVAGEQIVAVGSDEAVRSLIGPGTEVIDAGGATVLPGFVDAHNHVRLGSNPGAAQFFGAPSLSDIRDRLDTFADAHPDAAWIEGEGWNYSAIPGGSPTADMLEGAGRNKALFLFSYDVHTVWLNREAMTRLGITRDTVHLPWGTIEMDPGTGEPTGYVHDFAVLGISEEGQRALEPHIPGYAPGAQYERLVRSLDMATAFGITTIVEPQNGLDDIALFVRARQEGTLRSRLVAAMLCLPGTTAERLDALEDAKRTYADDRFRVGPIKLYIDDVIEPHTAAMLAPYANAATTGDTFWPPEEFAGFLQELERRGFQSFTHATGDRGIRTVLDAVQGCRRAFGPADARHQIVHVECVHADDVPRFGELGVVACMQPRHCAPDIVAEWRDNVGPARERYAWPLRSIAEAGGTLAFSSDWNVAEMDPMIWLYTAVSRADLEGRGAWNVEETVDLAQAVRAATLGSAYANFAEDRRGSIAPGKDADLIVLSRDLFEPGDPRAILDTRVTHTVVAGKVVHRAS
ncbi:MAG TPA: amidohydrolase family protein [Actinomycetota bacterium]|nr:amidohydrolase family protein [Actinomycetota bacterium]